MDRNKDGVGGDGDGMPRHLRRLPDLRNRIVRNASRDTVLN